MSVSIIERRCGRELLCDRYLIMNDYGVAPRVLARRPFQSEERFRQAMAIAPVGKALVGLARPPPAVSTRAVTPSIRGDLGSAARCMVLPAWSGAAGVLMVEWVGELTRRTSVLAASDQLPLLLGHFRCAPGDAAWGEVNRVGDVAHVVFPRTAVRIDPLGGTPMTADANRVLLYDAGQEYRRGLLDPRGDDCLFVALGPDAVARLGGGVVASDGTHQRFVCQDRPCPADTWASLHRLRALSAADDHDELAVDELLLALVEGVLEPEEPSRVDHLDDVPLAEAVRAVLAHRFRERLTLPEVAAEVGVSPYHLHRRFRAVTGWTIHAYRDHLRLREGLARVLDGEPDLSALAFDLGYSSHSHFTARFRRAFAATPSQVRRAGGVSSGA